MRGAVICLVGIGVALSAYAMWRKARRRSFENCCGNARHIGYEVERRS